MTGTSPTELTPRQNEILDRALDIIKEGGLSALTIANLADRVGFTEPALYRHFRNKREIIAGLMDMLDAMLVRPVQEIAGDPTLSASDKLDRILRHHMDLVLEYNSLPILLLAEASSSGGPALVDRIREILRGYLHALESVLTQGRASGEIGPGPQTDCLSLMLLGAPAALAIRHRLLPDGDLEGRTARSLVPFIVSAIASQNGRSS